jgi:hypothetical protein
LAEFFTEVGGGVNPIAKAIIFIAKLRTSQNDQNALKYIKTNSCPTLQEISDKSITFSHGRSFLEFLNREPLSSCYGK